MPRKLVDEGEHVHHVRNVGPAQGRNPSGFRFLRRFRLAGTVEGGRLANERLEGGRVDFFSFVDVDRAAHVSVEARVDVERTVEDAENVDVSVRLYRAT